MGVYLKQEKYVKAICRWQIATELKEEILYNMFAKFVRRLGNCFLRIGSKCSFDFLFFS